MNIHPQIDLAPTDEIARPATAGGCACGGGGAQPAGGPQAGGEQQPVERGPVPHVYALGRIVHRLPTPAIEKELAQVIARTPSAGLTDAQVIHAALSARENRYLAAKMCWLLTIEGVESYLLVPRDPWTLDLLIDSLRSEPRPTDVDVILGERGPIAPPEMCGGLQVPIVAVDHVYSFDVATLLSSIPRPESIPEKEFAAASEELFYRILQIADNAGATSEHRALNYVAVRYPALYSAVAQAHGRGESLSGVEVRRSRLSGARHIVDVILSFTSRATDVTEKMFCRVDVTEQLPFLVTKLSAFYDR